MRCSLLGALLLWKALAQSASRDDADKSYEGVVIHEMPELYETDGWTLKNGTGKVQIRMIASRPESGGVGDALGKLVPLFRHVVGVINRNPNVLPNHVLELHLTDSACTINRAVFSTVRALITKPKGFFHMVLGPLCSDPTGAVNDVLQAFRLFQVATISRSPKLSDGSKYPYLCRVSSPLQFVNYGIVRTLEVFGWRKIALMEDHRELSESTINFVQVYLEEARKRFDETSAHNPCGKDCYKFDVEYTRANKFVIDHSLNHAEHTEQFVVSEIKKRGVRIIVQAIYEDVGLNFFCELFQERYYGKNVQFILATAWWPDTWIDDGIKLNPGCPCTAEQVFDAASGSLSVAQISFWRSSTERHEVTEEIFNDIEKNYLARCTASDAEGCHRDFAPYDYDGVALVAKVFHTWLYERGHSLEEIYDNRDAQQQLYEITRSTTFHGTTGPVEFFDKLELDCERKGIFTVNQYGLLAEAGSNGWRQVVSFTQQDGFATLIPWSEVKWKDDTVTYFGDGSGFTKVQAGVPATFGSGSYGIEKVPQDECHLEFISVYSSSEGGQHVCERCPDGFQRSSINADTCELIDGTVHEYVLAVITLGPLFAFALFLYSVRWLYKHIFKKAWRRHCQANLQAATREKLIKRAPKFFAHANRRLSPQILQRTFGKLGQTTRFFDQMTSGLEDEEQTPTILEHESEDNLLRSSSQADTEGVPPPPSTACTDADDSLKSGQSSHHGDREFAPPFSKIFGVQNKDFDIVKDDLVAPDVLVMLHRKFRDADKHKSLIPHCLQRMLHKDVKETDELTSIVPRFLQSCVDFMIRYLELGQERFDMEKLQVHLKGNQNDRQIRAFKDAYGAHRKVIQGKEKSDYAEMISEAGMLAGKIEENYKMTELENRAAWRSEGGTQLLKMYEAAVETRSALEKLCKQFVCAQEDDLGLPRETSRMSGKSVLSGLTDFSRLTTSSRKTNAGTKVEPLQLQKTKVEPGDHLDDEEPNHTTESDDDSDNEKSNHDDANSDAIEFICAPIKGLTRLLEKFGLRDGELIWDCVRAMFLCKSCRGIINVLKFLEQLQEEGKIHIVQVGDRFSDPTKQGWSDISVYLYIDEDHYPGCKGLVVELQLVHIQFYIVREDFGAHDSYENNRFRTELVRKCFQHMKRDIDPKAPWLLRLPYSVHKQLTLEFKDLRRLSSTKW